VGEEKKSRGPRTTHWRDSKR